MAMIIKEYCKLRAHLMDQPIRFILRREDYSHRLNKIIELYDEARRDFPNLPLADVEIVQYGGRRYRRTFGIEFTLDTPIPAGYVEVAQVEDTL